MQGGDIMNQNILLHYGVCRGGGELSRCGTYVDYCVMQVNVCKMIVDNCKVNNSDNVVKVQVEVILTMNLR
ncbi:Hypothetical protein CINCED_3A014174 [Cinara cedri]|uniref:Uncharacterized protein n=1 Tax=Cinara cedri TaxID=506608 RepID=A0A5E4MD73_9HEMI|nr:Hypothetical protein CINCED_3A014174 [Cinara cedri]